MSRQISLGALLVRFSVRDILSTEEYQRLEDAKLIRRQFFGTHLIPTLRGRIALSRYKRNGSI